jgi:hypothetical protein
MKPTEDPAHSGNSAEYHTGKPCVVKGCKEPAGTWWGPSWCRQHNHERLERIGSNLNDMVKRAELRAAVEAETKSLRDLLHRAYRENRALVVAAGGKITVLPEHYTAKIVAESVRTPKGENGPKTYDYMVQI